MIDDRGFDYRQLQVSGSRCPGEKVEKINQIRLSDLLSGKAFHWLEFFVRNIPNTRLESRVIPSTQCFQYIHD